MNHLDAMRLQAENLEQAALSRVASRITSRVASIAPSLLASAIQSRIQSRGSKTPVTFKSKSASASRYDFRSNYVNINCINFYCNNRRGSMFDSGMVPSRLINPRQSIISDESSPETLENLIRVTQNQESILQTYYTDDNGDVVTLSVYDISHTDPTEIIGIE